MKFALISDIHANLQALESALAAIDAEGADAIYCMGDVVGYGADPGPCIDLIRDRCDGVVMGNHDLAVADGTNIGWLPPDGQIAAEYQRGVLSDDQRIWLKSLPYTLSTDAISCVHASPMEPDKWIRIESFFLAQAQFDYFDSNVCFVGHTHLPAILADRLGVLRVRPGHRYLINVGSVGQPRDGDSRASVGFFDSDAFAYRLERIPYNVDQACERILTAKLPSSLARRLQKGQ